MVWHVVTVVLAAATPAPTGSIAIDGSNVANWIKTLAGTLFLAIIAVRGLMAALKTRLLELAVLFALGGICAIFVYFPDTFQALGSALHSVLVSGG
jgi:hypothetical protein